MSMQQPEQVRESLDSAIGRRVHMLMWDRRMTQVELGRMIQMDQSSLAKRLRGERGWTPDQIADVARAMRTTVTFLFGEVDDPAWCTPRDLNPEPTVSGVGHLAEVVHLRRSLVVAA